MKYARAGSRIVVVAVAAGAIAIVGVQFEHAIANNVALGRELSQTRRDVEDLRLRRTRDEREVRRLSDARGSIPDIHARLRLVGSKEELIFVRYTTSTHGALETTP